MIRGTASLEPDDPQPGDPQKEAEPKPPAVVETGRIKAPPVCEDAEMIKTSMTTETLQQWVFEENAGVPPPLPEPIAKPPPPSVTAHMASTNSTHSAASNEPVSVVSVTSSNNSCGALSSDEANTLNTRIAQRKTSRNGRATQRWIKNTRLVVGCVPILKDSRILFVSASRKAEWILPKGGWEEVRADIILFV